jgi:hypothetical protein
MLYARKINRRINSGIYLGPTQGLSSPKNNRRACLCTKTDTYSRDCCNGDLIAQGIGSIQGTKRIVTDRAFSSGFNDGFN